MSLGFLKGFSLFIVLLLAQVLVLNHIHLFNCATPLLYIYVVLLFQRDFPRWGMLLSCFVMGLVIDIFSNTPGLTTLTLTLMGFIRPYLLLPFLNRDSAEDIAPSMQTMGFAKFSHYTAAIVFIHCLVFFSIEAFSFFNWLQWTECIGGSFLLTTILILVIENARKL